MAGNGALSSNPNRSQSARFLLLKRRAESVSLTAEGVFTLPAPANPETGEFLRGRYSLFETTHAYIKFLREGKLDDPDESNYNPFPLAEDARDC